MQIHNWPDSTMTPNHLYNICLLKAHWDTVKEISFSVIFYFHHEELRLNSINYQDPRKKNCINQTNNSGFKKSSFNNKQTTKANFTNWHESQYAQNKTKLKQITKREA